ncbi:MAG: Rrf2 family transcriptional regulator [Phycisphaerales bacterium]|nr:Rrf2 family transcriptional regulator [Phycisphaerales bacterium]MCB9864601.1 Rrf2 family transcriptional regulator [Phycisphaerales bacterium]
MLSLTRKTDYALIALCHLAGQPNRVCTAREIAEQHSLPQSLLMNVLKSLSQSDLVDSTRGAKGGYRLGKGPTEITLSAIISAVEGPVKFVQCASHQEGDDPACDIMESCPIRGPVQVIQHRLEAFLAGIVLADLAEHQSGDKRVNLSISTNQQPPTGGTGQHQAAN